MNGTTTVTGEARGVRRFNAVRRGHWLRQAYLIFLITLLTGALQRPLGGGDLEGSMTGVVIRSDNPTFKILMIAVFGLTAMALLLGIRRLRLPAATGFALGFNGLALLSMLWSPLPLVTLQGAVGLVFSALVAIYAISFYTWEHFSRALVQVMAGLVVVTGGLALVAPDYSFHGTNEFFAVHAGLLKGTYNHKNSLGAALTLALVVITSLGRGVLRPSLWWAVMAWAAWLIVQTGSAKSFVSVPAALLLGWQIARSRSQLTLGVVAGYFLVFSAVALTLGDGFGTLLGSFGEALGRDVTFSGRTLIWQAAIDYTILTGHWLAGGGFQAAWPAGIGDYSQQVIGFNAGHPHNGFIAIFDDLGLIGISMILGAVFFALKAAVARSGGVRERRFVASVLVMILVTNVAGTSLPLPVSLSWFLFVLLPFIPEWSKRGD